MTPDGKGRFASALLGGSSGSKDSASDEYDAEAAGDDMGREDAAKRLFSAFDKKDAAAFVAAFSELQQLCQE